MQKYMTATFPLPFHQVLSYLLAIMGTVAFHLSLHNSNTPGAHHIGNQESILRSCLRICVTRNFNFFSGHALMQMAEIYKEIQNQIDENVSY